MRLMEEQAAEITVPIDKIISGGQTGVDRAALDFAIANGIPHGGWCPAGRLAEDGPIPRRYRLKETPSSNYPERTEWNVRDSDGTVIITISRQLTGGSQLTHWMAVKHNKPSLHLSRERDGKDAGKKLLQFIQQHQIRILNVAGPRRSTEPAGARFARNVLMAFNPSNR